MAEVKAARVAPERQLAWEAYADVTPNLDRSGRRRVEQHIGFDVAWDLLKPQLEAALERAERAEAQLAKLAQRTGVAPSSVEIKGERYAVVLGLDDSGEIDYFRLLDSSGELFFEVNWTFPSLTEELIQKIYQGYTEQPGAAG